MLSRALYRLPRRLCRGVESQWKRLIGSTYFGGSSTARGSSIALDGQGNVYIAGLTDSSDLPLVNPVSTSGDFYVAEFNLSTGTLLNSTYLGGSNDQGFVTPVVVDDSGRVVVAGETASSSFPTTANAFQPNYGGGPYRLRLRTDDRPHFHLLLGNQRSGTPIGGPPSDPGTYTVIATFTSNNPNFANAQSAPVTFTISPSGPLTPTVVVLDGGGAYNGQPFAATATATSPGGSSVSGSFAFTNYVGTSATGMGSSVAPVDTGTYTVVADFTSSDPNYTDAESASATFTITPAATTTSVAVRPEQKRTVSLKH